MIRVFLLQVCLGNDSDINRVPILIRRKVLDCVRFGDGRYVEDVQDSFRTSNGRTKFAPFAVFMVYSRFKQHMLYDNIIIIHPGLPLVQRAEVV